MKSKETIDVMQLPAHIDISNTFKLIAKELEAVTTIISKQLTLPNGNETVASLFESFKNRSGKMIRPALVLLSGACFGKITNKHIQIAAIMELLHNATLLHDDVIDEGQIRRGKPTINRLYGNEPAVLLGDFLLSRAFLMCSTLELEIIKIISKTTACICEGELRQTTNKHNWNLNETEYIEIITKKSAALFSTCCRLGGHLSDGNEKQIQSLSDFGLNAGIAFQIADDLVDIIGDENKSGKTLGSDVDKNKPTLALVYTLNQLDKQAKKKFIKELNTKTSDSLPHGGVHRTTTIKAILKSHGSIEYVRNRVSEFINKASKSIADFEDNEAKKAMLETACFIRKLVN